MSTTTAVSTETIAPVHLYLDLLKGCLTRLLHPDSLMNRDLAPTGHFDPEARREGKDWPSEAETMIGMLRLDNIEFCVTDVLEKGPGRSGGNWRLARRCGNLYARRLESAGRS